MNTIKYLKEKKISLNGVKYKPYKVGELPPSFGRIILDSDAEKVSYGISEWFNHKGLTYVIDND